MTSIFSISLIIFIGLQLVNVMFSTVKSILTVNGGNLSAAIVNMMSYTFGAIVVKLITEQSFEAVIIVTALTNFIGVYVAKMFMDRIRPVKLWTMMATVKDIDKDEVERSIKHRNIQYVLISAENDRSLFNIFCYSKGETAMAQEVMKSKEIKYTITEHRKWTKD